MKNNDKKMNKAALFFGAGVCFFLAALFRKDVQDMLFGCAWIAVALIWVRKSRKTFGEGD